MKAYVKAVSIAPSKGMKKVNQPEVLVKENFGMEGDAHVGDWHRQVSLLAQESIDKMVARGLDVAAGDFAENITTVGIDLLALQIGDRLQVGPDVLLEITQKGKECHARCAIYDQAGDCVMPTEGIFARVLRGGRLTPEMQISVVTVQ